MVDACMGYTGCPSYFTTYQAAAVHYARSSQCQHTLRGISTVMLPNRPGDMEAGGSGAAAAWAGYMYFRYNQNTTAFVDRWLNAILSDDKVARGVGRG